MSASRKEVPQRRDLKPKRTDDGYTDWYNEWLQSEGSEPYRPPKREPRTSEERWNLGDKLAVTDQIRRSANPRPKDNITTPDAPASAAFLERGVLDFDLHDPFPAAKLIAQLHCSTGAPMSGYLSEYKSPSERRIG